MARRYYISGEVSDGEFVSESMSANYDKAELSSILFYSDEFQTVVTPTGGEIVFTMSADGINYRSVDSGTFAAAQAYDPARTAPSGINLAVKAKLLLDGVTGATHFTATIWRA